MGAFGRVWMMNYYVTDVDIPEADPLGKECGVIFNLLILFKRSMEILVRSYTPKKTFKEDESSLQTTIRRLQGKERFPGTMLESLSFFFSYSF